MPAPTSDVNMYLETLGLKPDDLNENAVRVAYKKLALQWHPDRHNADPEEAKEKFIEINDAYKALVEECKKRHKRRKPHKEEESSSTRRPFWASSAPSTSSSSGSTPSASSPRSSYASEPASKETEIPTSKPTDPQPAKPSEEQSTHSADSTSAKHTNEPRSKASSSRKEKHTDSCEHESRSSVKTRRSGDRDSSHSSPKAQRSHPKASTATPKSPRSSKTSNLHHDIDTDSSSEEDSLHEHKPQRLHRRKGKKFSLGEDDYEFIDLGTPLKPLRSPRQVSSSKDWIFPLYITLEDLYFGATHRYRITRTLNTPSSSDIASHKSSHSPSSSQSKTQSVQIDVHISPGWRTDTRIRVPGVGNQRSDGSFQDIVFVVEEAPHPRLTRSGDDLVLPVRVPWADSHSRPYPPADFYEDDDSLLGQEDGGTDGGRYKLGFGKWRNRGHSHGHEYEEDEVYVMGMDGEEYTLPIPRSLVEAADGTRIYGAGMPIRKNGKVVGKGDLVIRWEFVFPESDKMQRSRWQTLKDAMHLRFQV